VADDFRTLAPFLTQLAGVGRVECGPDAVQPPQSAGHVHPDFDAYVSLRGLIDVDVEIARLEKQLGERRKQLESARGKLNNQGFLSKAGPEKVQEERDRVADLENQLRTLEENVKCLRQS
jgi:valyl-tRNA synthetase